MSSGPPADRFDAKKAELRRKVGHTAKDPDRIDL